MAVTIDGDGLIALGGTSSTQGRVRLAEDSDNGTNYIELTAPASVGSDRVITFPDATTTVVGTDTTQTLTNKTLGSGLVADASLITSGTSQASTSGTSIDFTGIPSWAKRITVMFNGVSLSGTSNILVQLGDSGGVENTGYISTSFTITDTPGVVSTSSTAGGVIRCGANGVTVSGNYVLCLVSSNLWSGSCLFLRDEVNTSMVQSAMKKSLSDTLDRVRITTVNGTDTFDAGSINILFE